MLHERVNTYTEFLSHSQPTESGAIAWVEHPHTGKIPLANAAGIRPHDPDQPMHAPALGEHTSAILKELGYSAERIDDLMTRGVVGAQHAEG